MHGTGPARSRNGYRPISPARDRKITLGEFAGEWIESTLEASDRKATTKAMYATITRKHIVNAKIGAKPLDKLRPSHIDAWKVELQGRGLSESTIKTAYTILRALVDSAVRDRALAQNPAHAVRRPKVTAKEAAYLKPKQVRSLLAAAEGSRYAPLFALLVNTGLRRGEALALHWSDVDLDEKLLRARTCGRRVDLDRNEDAQISARRAALPHRRATVARHPHPAGGRAATCRVHVEADTVRLHDRAR